MNIEIPVCWVCNSMAATTVERFADILSYIQFTWYCQNSQCEKYQQPIDPSWEKVEVKDDGQEEID